MQQSLTETWYHVWLPERKVWGFAVKNETVTKAPYEYGFLIGQTLQEIKPFLIKEKAQVSKV